MSTAAVRLFAALGMGWAVMAGAVSCRDIVSTCSPAQCGGCCNALGACVPLAEQGFAECGNTGAACGACAPGQVCLAGSCTVDRYSDGGGTPPPTCGTLGQPCCPSLLLCAAGLVCRGGTCRVPSAPPDAGPQDSGSGAPDSGGPADSGTAGKKTGSACAQDSVCAGDLCIRQIAPGANGCLGPATCWPGGYCSQNCGTCAAGSSCSVLSISGVTVCLETCTQPLGQDICRAGYVCDRGWLPDPLQPACIFACQAAHDCGASTSYPVSCMNGFCCGVTNLSCCGGIGGTCAAGACGTDGYCH